MRAAISLLVLLLSMCGVQTRSTQTDVQPESQGTGAAAAAAEVSTQLDVSAELKELRDMVVELRAMLRYTQDDVKVLEADNVAMNMEVNNLKTENAAQEVELAILKTRLVATEIELDLKMDSTTHEQELTAVKTSLAVIETAVDDLTVENAAQEAELTAVKTRLAAIETEVENLEKEIRAAPKVAFSAVLRDSGAGTTESGSKDLNLVFKGVFTNVGESYSSTTGFFTAPVRGVYYFRFTVMDILNSHHMHIRMQKNGESLMYLYEYETDGVASYVSSGLTLQLEKGDVINMLLPANRRLYDDVKYNHNTFSGFLLFPL